MPASSERIFPLDEIRALLAVIKPFLLLIVSVANFKATPFSPPINSIIKLISLSLTRSIGSSNHLNWSIFMDLFLFLLEAEIPEMLKLKLYFFLRKSLFLIRFFITPHPTVPNPAMPIFIVLSIKKPF